MKAIKLTNGGEALIDDEDFERFKHHPWYCYRRRDQHTSYARAAAPGKKTLLLHRLILGARPGQIVDHINGNGLDCRRSNLRFCTARENAINHRVFRTNKHRYPGIVRVYRKWHAHIKVNGKRIHLGSFDWLDVAILHRMAAEEKYFGEFAPWKCRPNHRKWIKLLSPGLEPGQSVP